ncbi:MAG: hypothetical protein ACO31I_10285 [Prochlorotrichaceae cyanobacterium]|jgi:hypothetical protein
MSSTEKSPEKSPTPEKKTLERKTKSELTIYHSALPDHRPIGPSAIAIASTFGRSEIRPIGCSAIVVKHSFYSPSQRPVTADTFVISKVENIAGLRPIMTSSLAISRTDRNFGPRPVASNQIDDTSEVMMGYLD